MESISTAAGGGNHPGGFSNPRYVFEGRGVTVGGEEEREGGEPEDSDDDLPPPYSPGLAGQQAGEVKSKVVSMVTCPSLYCISSSICGSA